MKQKLFFFGNYCSYSRRWISWAKLIPVKFWTIGETCPRIFETSWVNLEAPISSPVETKVICLALLREAPTFIF